MPATPATPQTAAQAAAAAAQQNQMARNLIMSQALEMQTQLSAQTLSPTVNNAGQVINITPRNVGLLKGFYVEYTALIKNTNASAAITPTPLSTLNLFSNIQFTDLQNNVRINCPGYQIGLLNSVKQKNPFATAFLNSSIDCPVKYGANSTGTIQGTANQNVVWQAPVSLAATVGGYVTGVLWIPVSYSDHDYRGALYSNVVNGQMNLQFTVNPTPGYVSGSSVMMAMYGPADTATSVQVLGTTVNVTQVYMDQLPIDPRSGYPILPQRDISTIYELKNTTFTAAAANNDFPMQYPNFRDILSSIVILDPLIAPSNVPFFTNYFALQAANTTNIFKRTAALNQALTRNIMGFDLPNGISYFSYRQKPLSTTQYGNLQLVFNGNSNWLQSYAIYHCWESFASIATITQSGSLAAS
jgi:P3 major capsid protein